jgi:hypothetical protein
MGRARNPRRCHTGILAGRPGFSGRRHVPAKRRRGAGSGRLGGHAGFPFGRGAQRGSLRSGRLAGQALHRIGGHTRCSCPGGGRLAWHRGAAFERRARRSCPGGRRLAGQALRGIGGHTRCGCPGGGRLAGQALHRIGGRTRCGCPGGGRLAGHRRAAFERHARRSCPGGRRLARQALHRLGGHTRCGGSESMGGAGGHTPLCRVLQVRRRTGVRCARTRGRRGPPIKTRVLGELLQPRCVPLATAVHRSGRRRLRSDRLCFAGEPARALRPGGARRLPADLRTRAFAPPGLRRRACARPGDHVRASGWPRLGLAVSLGPGRGGGSRAGRTRGRPAGLPGCIGRALATPGRAFAGWKGVRRGRPAPQGGRPRWRQGRRIRARRLGGFPKARRLRAGRLRATRNGAAFAQGSAIELPADLSMLAFAARGPRRQACPCRRAARRATAGDRPGQGLPGTRQRVAPDRRGRGGFGRRSARLRRLRKGFRAGLGHPGAFAHCRAAWFCRLAQRAAADGRSSSPGKPGCLASPCQGRLAARVSRNLAGPMFNPAAHGGVSALSVKRRLLSVSLRCGLRWHIHGFRRRQRPLGGLRSLACHAAAQR